MRGYTLSLKKELFNKFVIAYQLAGLEKENKLIKKHWKILKKHGNLKPLQLKTIIVRERLY